MEEVIDGVETTAEVVGEIAQAGADIAGGVLDVGVELLGGLMDGIFGDW